ncbi:TVP38/TMEM64 family protein [Heliobacterium chlorum]|uniref:TVP38/TMEM64 family membrane protein n=1 Tax=Heliobacterium chlorum TaxID=2698 RepID=A0ABR7T345_HELCL|nr:TVP38/TMEM64 family protein [Heliobacterium chlorum]
MKKKLTIVGILISLFFIMMYFGTSESGYRIVSHLFAQNGSALVEDFRTLGWEAWLISFLIVVLQNFLGFLPSIFMSALLAGVFGIGPAFFISWGGEVVGALVAFILFRYYGRSYAAQWMQKREKLSRLDAWTAQHGFMSMFLIRVAPMVPSGAVNFAAALSSISFSAFFWGTFFGKIPSIFFEVVLGNDIWDPAGNAGRIVIVLLVLGLVTLGLKFYFNKKDNSFLT